MKNTRKFNLGCGHCGNGIVVWNSLKEEFGDYERIAHIDADRKINWRLKNPPIEIINYVKEIVNGPNCNVSITQKDKWVFNN